MEDYDFSCWVIRYDRMSLPGLLYSKGCLKNNDNKVVPLLWNHKHFDYDWMLGWAMLEHREDGVYVYCKLNVNPINDCVKEILSNKGRLSISPFITHVKRDDSTVFSGNITEVSLVFARAVPDELYYPVMKTND